MKLRQDVVFFDKRGCSFAISNCFSSILAKTKCGFGAAHQRDGTNIHLMNKEGVVACIFD